RDTIWAMNKEQITFEDLKGRVSNFVLQAKASVPLTRFSFTFPQESSYAFRSKNGIEIFRIIQEAVHNAIKHAEASEISISIEEQENSLTIRITDNGHGFDPEATSIGQGLAYMKNRANLLGGQISWNSAPGHTSVHLLLNKQTL